MMDVRPKDNQYVLPGLKGASGTKQVGLGNGAKDNAARETARKQARKGQRFVRAFVTQLGFFGDYKSSEVLVVSNANVWSRIPKFWKRKQSPLEQVFSLVARARNGR